MPRELQLCEEPLRASCWSCAWSSSAGCVRAAYDTKWPQRNISNGQVSGKSCDSNCWCCGWSPYLAVLEKPPASSNHPYSLPWQYTAKACYSVWVKAPFHFHNCQEGIGTSKDQAECKGFAGAKRKLHRSPSQTASFHASPILACNLRTVSVALTLEASELFRGFHDSPES